MSNLSRYSIVFYTLTALVAFAANSVLCRMALSPQQTSALIDPNSFTAIRLAAGAVMLWLIMRLRMPQTTISRSASCGSAFSAVLLFIYAVTFSYAYVLLDTATGALILFAAVQMSMMLISYFQGHRLTLIEGWGAFLAFSGFVYLVLPDVNAPSMTGLALMAISGCAWGGYTLLGKQSVNPLCDTGYNFIRTLPLVIVMIFVVWQLSPLVSIHQTTRLTTEGIVLAILSGAIASGIGYTLWYQALRGLTSTHAAVLQLTVPVIAAAGGIVFLHEVISFHLGVSACIIFLGIALVIFSKAHPVTPKIKN
ncbi:DMT family transporter [Shewanella sp. A14]